MSVSSKVTTVLSTRPLVYTKVQFRTPGLSPKRKDEKGLQACLLQTRLHELNVEMYISRIKLIFNNKHTAEHHSSTN